jgi:hypothetical protein
MSIPFCLCVDKTERKYLNKVGSQSFHERIGRGVLDAYHRFETPAIFFRETFWTNVA